MVQTIKNKANWFHQWGMKKSYFGLTNYMWLGLPSLIIAGVCVFLFGGNKNKLKKSKAK